VRLALNFLILMLVALAFTLIPGGDAAINVLLTALTLALFVGIGFFGYTLYRQNWDTVASMTTLQRGSLYGSVALAFLVFTATPRLFEYGITGILLWFGLLVVSSLGAFLAYSRSRRLYG
jgi:hypothetical protein